MKIVKAVPHKPTPIGKTGTCNSLLVQFDVKDWLDEYPDCTIVLTHKRPKDNEGLPVSQFEIVGDNAEWIVDLGDTEFAGDGKCELKLMKQNVVVKSITYTTQIQESIAGTEEDPPAPYQGWVDSVIQSGVAAQEAVKHYPYIDPDTYHWIVWDVDNEEFVDTQISAMGASPVFPYSDSTKKHNYLYELWFDNIDYYSAYQYFKAHDEGFSGGCSSVRNGKYFGRKFDWFYNNEVEFIVNVPHIGNRYASIGIAAGLSQLTKDFVEQGKPNNVYSIIPFHLTDGMNERGLVCNMNVVPTDYGVNVSIPTSTQEVEICSTMIVRYVIDHFDDARVAANYIKEHMKVYFPQALHSKNYEVHFMIADPYKTCIVEFVNNQAVVIDNQYHYMTNFFLYGIVPNQDGTVYTPYTQDATHDARTTNLITRYGSGLERFNIIVEHYHLTDTENGMWDLMNLLDYSKAYPGHSGSAEPKWYTEFVGGGLTSSSDVSEFNNILYEAQEAYENRSRDNPVTWHSVHSIVYNMENKTATLKVQEQNTTYETVLHFGARFS